jgi:hypothetical protein
MKMACVVSVLVLLGGAGLLAPRPALAHGGENERKGFLLGGSVGLVRPVAPDLDDRGYSGGGLVGPVLDLRIGGGFAEGVLLMFESITTIGASPPPGARDRILAQHTLVSVQRFAESVDPNLYARAGAGVAWTRVRTTPGADATASAVGRPHGAGRGYEWRFGSSFTVTFELGTLFTATELAIIATPLATLGSQWYW